MIIENDSNKMLKKKLVGNDILPYKTLFKRLSLRYPWTQKNINGILIG